MRSGWLTLSGEALLYAGIYGWTWGGMSHSEKLRAYNLYFSEVKVVALSLNIRHDAFYVRATIGATCDFVGEKTDVIQTYPLPSYTMCGAGWSIRRLR